MWNDIDVAFVAKPKVERLGFLSQSETFSYGNSQMSFLNDDTDYIIQKDIKNDAYISKVDHYSHPPVEVETKTTLDVPLDNDDDQDNDETNFGTCDDINKPQQNLDQKDEEYPSIGINRSEALSLLGNKYPSEDVTMEKGTESESEITLDIHELENLVDKSTDYDIKTEPDIPDFKKDIDLLKKYPNDGSMETQMKSNETNDQVNLVNQHKVEDPKADIAVKKKRKTSTHKKKWPEDPADCDICGTHYTTKRSYQRHYKIVHELRIYDCKHCSQQFRWPDRLAAHIKLVHLGIKKKTYPCDKCDKVMTEPRILRNHKAREHPPPGCESCKVSFQDMEGLQEHIRVEHLEKYCHN